MQVSRDILNEIADNLEMGFKCYLNRGSLELVAFPDPDQYSDMDNYTWKDELSNLRKNKKKLIEIEKTMPSDSFRVMEEFVLSLPNNSTRIRLVTALEEREPFANFKQQIDNSGQYREQWFAFRRQKILNGYKISSFENY
ncbi:MAG TPA: UPF0158 family protein [Chitinophagaceae bacterium]